MSRVSLSTLLTVLLSSLLVGGTTFVCDQNSTRKTGKGHSQLASSFLSVGEHRVTDVLRGRGEGGGEVCVCVRSARCSPASETK